MQPDAEAVFRRWLAYLIVIQPNLLISNQAKHTLLVFKKTLCFCWLCLNAVSCTFYEFIYK